MAVVYDVLLLKYGMRSRKYSDEDSFCLPLAFFSSFLGLPSLLGLLLTFSLLTGHGRFSLGSWPLSIFRPTSFTGLIADGTRTSSWRHI